MHLSQELYHIPGAAWSVVPEPGVGTPPVWVLGTRSQLQHKKTASWKRKVHNQIGSIYTLDDVNAVMIVLSHKDISVRYSGRLAVG